MYKLFKTKRKIVIGCLCLIFAGCSYMPYRYDFSLIEPQNETMDFEDENIKFKFIPSSENIRLTISNKTDHEINLVMDKAEYIDLSGEARRIHYGYDYAQEAVNFVRENKTYARPMKIESGSEITGNVWINIWPDFCIGDNRVDASYGAYYLMEPLLPRNRFEGRGEDLKNSTFSLILPIDFDGHISNYTFTFMINDVVE